MAECLILGLAGAGKSSVVAELTRRGHIAYDADEPQSVHGLSGWFDASGLPCTYNSDPAWRARHQFLWDMNVLERFLHNQASGQMLYLAGTATNVFDAIPLFSISNVVFLDAKVSTLCQRLSDPNRRTPYPFDCTPEHRSWIAEAVPRFREKLLGLGATAINAEAELVQVVDSLIAAVEK